MLKEFIELTVSPSASPMISAMLHAMQSIQVELKRPLALTLSRHTGKHLVVTVES